MDETRNSETSPPPSEAELPPVDGATEGGSRRQFMRRAVYVAPIVWSISARQALAASGGSASGGGPGPGLPNPF